MSPKARRRRFTAAYKKRILELADGCTEKGAIGALLRREGLYSSHLGSWRAALVSHGQHGLEPKKRGPAPKAPAGRADTKRIAELEQQVRRLTARAERAEALVDIQKKVAALLGRTLPDESEQP